MTRTTRILLWVVVVAAVVVVLFAWVFPWVESRTQDPAIGTGGEPTVAAGDHLARAPR